MNDSISKTFGKQGRENYDRIFSGKKQNKQYSPVDIAILQCEIKQLEEELSFTKADLDMGIVLLKDAQIEIDNLKKEQKEKEMSKLWTSRIVLPNNTVIMPRQILQINFNFGNISYVNNDNQADYCYDLNNIRVDRLTPFFYLPINDNRGQGEPIYENDLAEYQGEVVRIYFSDLDCVWAVYFERLNCVADELLSDISETLEFIEIKPYRRE